MDLPKPKSFINIKRTAQVKSKAWNSSTACKTRKQRLKLMNLFLRWFYHRRIWSFRASLRTSAWKSTTNYYSERMPSRFERSCLFINLGGTQCWYRRIERSFISIDKVIWSWVCKMCYWKWNQWSECKIMPKVDLSSAICISSAYLVKSSSHCTLVRTVVNLVI